MGLCSCDRFEFLLLGLIWEEHEEQLKNIKNKKKFFLN